MNKVYARINWENYPSENTPLNESNLNKIDYGLNEVDNRVIELDTTKVSSSALSDNIKSWSMDEATGIITIEKYSGEKVLFDLNIEKIPVSFSLSDGGILTMTTDDGTQFTADIGSMIPVLVFEDSDTIAVSVIGTGVNKTYSFSIKTGSVTGDMLETNYLSNINVKVAEAEGYANTSGANATASGNSATLSESWAVGGTGTRDGENTNNAKYYAEQAASVSNVEIATTEKAGLVKPDGTTITVDADGTIHASAESGTTDYSYLENKPSINGVELSGNKTFEELGISASGISFDDTTAQIGASNVQGAIEELKNSVSNGKTLVANAITEKGVATEPTDSFNTMAENIGKIESGELHGAVISVTTEETALIGKTVTLSKDDTVLDTKTFDENGACSFTDIQEVGDYKVSASDGTNSTSEIVTITSDNIVNKTVLSCVLSLLKIVTFADGTDEEILAMVQAHYDDKINIADYWAVGDTRNVALSSMSATGVGESHRAQTVQFVIGDFEHDDLVTPINGHTKAAITLLQKDCLMDVTSASNSNNGSNDTEKGYMNSSNTNVGGWKNCARRTWCNNTYYSALPSVLKSMVKTVNKKSGTGNGSSSGTEITQDKIFLASEIEIFGSTTYSVSGEGTQYQYYKNATANRYKMPKWDSSSSYVSNIYWERSPFSGNTTHFCIVNASGNASFNSASSAFGFAPGLCI